MKRIIDFDIWTADPQPAFPDLHVTGTETIRVEFDWDEKEDVMKAAMTALEKQMMDRIYEVYYWWWIQ